MRRFKLLLDLVLMFIILFLFIHKARAEAVFELELQNFLNSEGRNSDGHCCQGIRDKTGSCVESCSVKLRICLNVYQQNIDPASPCEFGEKWTPVLGRNNVNFANNEYKSLQFKLDSWQGTFSLIVEAWHEPVVNSSIGPSLISRLKMNKFLDIGAGWTQDVSRTAFTELGFRYRVVCEAHYHGDGCRTFCRPRNDSFGHFSCAKNGSMLCLPGWTDSSSYCQTAICREGCQGTCKTPNQCDCSPGWEGPNCDQCIVYPGCKHGTCNKKYECNCEEGWGGLLCNIDLNYCTSHQPCKNGATCLNTGFTPSYECKCLPGFSGTNCEIVDHTCSNQPCRNGGTCYDRGHEGFLCECAPGYQGTLCESVTPLGCLDEPCRNGATCQDVAGGFKCTCPQGFTGFDCSEVSVDCSSRCRNGGSCISDSYGARCVCPLGFSGPACERELDCSFIPCANGGSCLGSSCLCLPGWTGRFCSEPVPRSPCADNPCEYGGACQEAPELSVGYRCQCPPGILGPRCTVFHRGARTTSRLSDDIPMSPLQIALIALFSLAVPGLACGSYAVIVCLRRRRRLERSKHDDEVRRQNDLNSGKNKNHLGTDMIFNSLDYPHHHKTLNINSSTSSLPPGKDPDAPSPTPVCKTPVVENAYCVAPARSVKTLNIDASRHSLAREVDPRNYLKASSTSPHGAAIVSNVSKTPEPYAPHYYSESLSYSKSNLSGSSLLESSSVSTSARTTPASLFFTDPQDNEKYIATPV